MTTPNNVRITLLVLMLFILGAQSSCSLNQFTLLSYNIRTDQNHMDANAERWLETIVQRIVTSEAQVVLLQEVEEQVGEIDDIPAEIVARLRDRGINYNYRYIRRFAQPPHGYFGQMVMSRHDLSQYEEVWIDYEGIGHDRSDVIQTFTTQLWGQDIRFYNYHPVPSRACDAAKYLNKIVSARRQYHDIIAGDFNRQSDSRCLDDFTKKYDNVCHIYLEESTEDSCLYSFDYLVWQGGRHAPPALGQAIDHVYLTADQSNTDFLVEVVSINIDHQANQPLAVSDHFPVTSRFLMSGR